MTDKQKELLNEMTEVSQECGLYECSYKGECHQMGCLDDKDCFIRQLFEERDSAERALYRKEQECKALREEKAYTDMACEQFEQQLEAYKMEAEEGKEINAELKADNEKLKNFHINLVGVKECEIRELARYEQAIEKIKEIAEKNYKTEEELFKIRHSRLPKVSMGVLNGKHNLASEILQICDEVNDVQDNL